MSLFMSMLTKSSHALTHTQACLLRMILISGCVALLNSSRWRRAYVSPVPNPLPQADPVSLFFFPVPPLNLPLNRYLPDVT